jgi:hypothetical protein
MTFLTFLPTGGGEVLGKAEVSHECERQFFHEMLTNKSATARWLLLSDPE